MTIAERTAWTVWEGSVAAARGRLQASRTTTLDGATLTWASRTQRPNTETSREESAAAAHSALFAMALASTLDLHHTPPQHLAVTATVILEEVDDVPTITTSQITAHARVAGLDTDQFTELARQAAALCPVSRLFAGARVTVDAHLEGDPGRVTVGK